VSSSTIPNRLRRDRRGAEAGFSIVEAVVATAIATIAGIGIAYSLSTARALIDRYETARTALGAAQGRLERVVAAPNGSPWRASGDHGPLDVVIDGRTVARERWSILPFEDPLPGSSGVRRLTVVVEWAQGGAAESVTLTTLLYGS
jgi:hypothetical protein